METIKVHEICGYLPYGLMLRCQTEYDTADVPMTSITVLNGQEIIRCGSIDFYLNEEEENGFSMKPLLLPLSHLTKPIVYNGVEVIPLVELAKMAMPDKDCKIDEKGYCTSSSSDFEAFILDESLFCFRHWDNEEGDYCKFNQLALFQKLHEYHFDLYGLIERNLAIDKTNRN